MNVDQKILVERLVETGLSTRRFLKLNAEKEAFEPSWQHHLYTPEELEGYPYWGICGKDGLVLVDADTVDMDATIRRFLSPTFEVRSPRRGLGHFYIVVEGGQVENKTLHWNGEEEGSGEIRAQNEYLVAPGTTIQFRDLRTSEPRTGAYTITQNRPLAKFMYDDFMAMMKPYLGGNPKQPITFEQMRKGVPQGTRHAQGIKHAVFLVGVKKFDYATALFTLGEWNKLCTPPMDDDDLERMVKNAIEYDATNPAQKRNEVTQEINPVVLAKGIKSNHIFIVEENSRQLYVYSEKDGYYKSHAEELIKTEIVQRLDEDSRARYYQDVSFFIIAGAEVKPFNDNPELLVCKNGVLDVVKRELQPFSPSLFINTKIPVEYDPKASCPVIDRVLLEVMGKKQILAFQELVGHALYRKMLHNKAGLFVGSGANGKTKLLALIKALLGKDNVSALTLQDMCHNRFSLAVMFGKLANICGDLPSKKLKNTGGFKLGTGDDTIHAEIKNKMPFPFVNTAKIFFSCNIIPPIDEAEDCYAFFRRWIILEFNNVFEGKKADKHLLEKITTPSELSGFLNFALEGLKRLLENGDFSVNETVEQMRKQYIKRSDSVKAFIEENIEVTNEYSDWIEIHELYKAFVRYCQKEKIATVPQRVFTTDMTEHCVGAEYKVHRLTKEELEDGSTKKQIHVWSYIKLKNVADVTDVTKPTMPAISTLLDYSTIHQDSLEKTPYKKEASIASPVTSVTSVTESDPSSEPNRTGLIPCLECKAKGKTMMFCSDVDLRTHMSAYHETEDYVS
jgi:P4 family phage/plasmid primase-like protien